ncbi:MAG: hypothetical protein ABJB03_07535 [Rhodoglobus sp.]
MTPSTTLRSAAVALAVAALLAGCSAATPPVDVASNSPAPSASSVAGQYPDLSVYYPVGLGNTWVYSIDFGSAGGLVTDTEVMSKIVPDDGGQRVTIDRTFHYEDGSQADLVDSVDYIFMSDGSLSVPFQSVPTGAGVVTVKSGTMVWPTVAEFEAGTAKTGTIEASVAAGGATTDETVDFSIHGAGTESTTVTAGTYTARKLAQDLTISIPALGVSGIAISATTWLAEGVGPVRTEIPDIVGGGAIVQQLVSFSPGKGK